MEGFWKRNFCHRKSMSENLPTCAKFLAMFLTERSMFLAERSLNWKVQNSKPEIRNKNSELELAMLRKGFLILKVRPCLGNFALKSQHLEKLARILPPPNPRDP